MEVDVPSRSMNLDDLGSDVQWINSTDWTGSTIIFIALYVNTP